MTLVIAHRGDWRDAGENTLAAVLTAVRGGADVVEVDVRLTADGVPVLHHDPTLRRTHGIRDRTDALTAVTLRRRAPGVPALAEALDAMRRTGVPMLLDVRSPAAALAALDVVRSSGTRVGGHPPARRRTGGPAPLPLDAPVWFCGRPAALQAVRDRAPRAVIMLSWRCLFGPSDALVSRLAPTLFNPWHGLVNQRVLDAWARRGLRVSTWTVDDPARRRRLRTLGVDALITNAVTDAVHERDGRGPGRPFGPSAPTASRCGGIPDGAGRS